MSHSKVLVDKKEKRKRSLMKKVNLNKLTTVITIKSKNSPTNICKRSKLMYPYKYNKYQYKSIKKSGMQM